MHAMLHIIYYVNVCVLSAELVRLLESERTTFLSVIPLHCRTLSEQWQEDNRELLPQGLY